jgi:hypothetical protein
MIVKLVDRMIKSVYMKYFFYGTECPHCHVMLPIVEKLNEEGMEIEVLETWHNEENAKKLETFDTGLCGGVPFFYNTETKKSLCGQTDEKEVRAWAKGK